MTITSTSPGGSDESERVDFETAISDPAAYYPEPEAILADTELTHAQKERFLCEWAQDLVDRQVADQEGMVPPEDAEAADAALLRRINHAIEQLKDAEDAEPAEPRSFWKRFLGG